MEVAKYLVEQGASVSSKSIGDFQPVHVAAQYGHFDVLKFLVDGEGADPSAGNVRNETALIFAAGGGHLNIVKWLVNDQECEL